MSQAEKRCQRVGHDVPRGFQTDHPDAVVEDCKRCGKRLIYNKGKDGGIDNNLYYKDHIGLFAQPRGKTSGIYEELYGRPKEDEDPAKFYAEREAKRLEDFERLMKATGNTHWYAKHKRQIQGL